MVWGLPVSALMLALSAAYCQAQPMLTLRRPTARLVPLVTFRNPLGPSEGQYRDPDPRAAAFSADGRRLAIASEAAVDGSDAEDCRVAVWDVRSGRRLALLTAEGTGFVRGVVLSADGSMAAVGAERGTWAWSVSDGRVVARILGACSGLAFRGRPARLLVLGRDGTLASWSAGVTRLRRLRHARCDFSEFLADGRRVVALRGGKTRGRSHGRVNADWDVLLLDTATGATKVMRRVIQDGRMQYFSIAQKAGRTAVFEWWDTRAYVADPIRGRPIASPRMGRWCHQMSISPDGRLLLFGADNGGVLLANGDTGAEIAIAHLGVSFVAALCWSPDGTLAAGIAGDSTVDSQSTVARVWRCVR